MRVMKMCICIHALGKIEVMLGTEIGRLKRRNNLLGLLLYLSALISIFLLGILAILTVIVVPVLFFIGYKLRSSPIDNLEVTLLQAQRISIISEKESQKVLSEYRPFTIQKAIDYQITTKLRLMEKDPKDYKDFNHKSVDDEWQKFYSNEVEKRNLYEL